ncbi:uncharacterized protein [Gossypium hirsutum]|uniref:RNase H type-1 domain-containing protein n=1 Tax=Gossypium hirsutum TaxID=3635 RepID=A0ABM3A9P8_GOSHI|nr:uncharacterized protein LOC121218449 [Gossypium hirsutum]
MELIKEFDSGTFSYLPRDENQMVDALTTLASMFKVNKLEDMKPIQISIYEASTHCCNIDNEEGKDDHPWYHDILRYVKSREYPDHATENDKKTLRRLAIDYILDGEILYKKGKDQVLLRCVDVVEAKEIMEEVPEEDREKARSFYLWVTAGERWFKFCIQWIELGGLQWGQSD